MSEKHPTFFEQIVKDATGDKGRVDTFKCAFCLADSSDPYYCFDKTFCDDEHAMEWASERIRELMQRCCCVIEGKRIVEYCKLHGEIESGLKAKIEELERQMSEATEVDKYVAQQMIDKSIPITGVHLYTKGGRIVVAVEVGGKWTDIIQEARLGEISHICETGGIRECIEEQRND